VTDARVETAVLVGEAMRPLAETLEGRVNIVHVPDASVALDRLRTLLAPGDAVLVKGSNGVGLARVIAGLKGG
jgi:UDP-N-acetylmuramoyl-tripeptide--D-alanyl-D-alanine ligase